MTEARYVYKATILMMFHTFNNIQWWVGKLWVNDSHAMLMAFPFILHLSLLCDDIDWAHLCNMRCVLAQLVHCNFYHFKPILHSYPYKNDKSKELWLYFIRFSMKRSVSKQWRLRSDTAWCSVWSGSAMFVFVSLKTLGLCYVNLNCLTLVFVLKINWSRVIFH